MVILGTIVLFLRISLRPIGCKRENPNILCSNETKELQHPEKKTEEPHIHKHRLSSKSSQRRYFVKKAALKRFSIFTGKPLYCSLEYCETLKNTYFEKTSANGCFCQKVKKSA